MKKASRHRAPTWAPATRRNGTGGTDIKRRGRRLPQKQEIKIKVNEQITYPEVRLIDADGEQLGIVSTKEALDRAYDQDLDLVEVSASAKPPVCRIMNYDKFRYEQKKKQQEAKKKQTVIETKEIKFRPKTEEHDLNFKIKKIKKFLAAKNKVKITMRFRGREIIYAQSIGLDALKKIADELRDDCVIIQEPKMEGRQLVMFVGPKA
ncbi:translation initiation factor IF-3 [Desulfolithobacter dissulfuricans]|uniref:Translation initiation factor IF-3 n=1 Tax=Desulfolithobacter dissulfuricans TaxID=2795293 RepID=A0A915U1S7_9BACT|nr:translation initiation factor IF-3 [Desulfolithobacter dissulfuricans]BCO09534.1 translation initiation factor IF-3 [Desulfolithobacter dissulfuricans]